MAFAGFPLCILAAQRDKFVRHSFFKLISLRWTCEYITSQDPKTHKALIKSTFHILSAFWSPSVAENFAKFWLNKHYSFLVQWAPFEYHEKHLYMRYICILQLQVMNMYLLVADKKSVRFSLIGPWMNSPNSRTILGLLREIKTNHSKADFDGYKYIYNMEGKSTTQRGHFFTITC